jgi:hypothetical protein
MSEDELVDVKKLLTACNRAHEANRDRQDKEHLKKVRRAIWLPVGVLSGLLLLVLTTLYGIGVSNAGTLKAVELQTKTLETQTLTIGGEIESRTLSDAELRKEILRLDEQLDTRFQWLIENGNFKTRGVNPLIKKP